MELIKFNEPRFSKSVKDFLIVLTLTFSSLAHFRIYFPDISSITAAVINLLTMLALLIVFPTFDFILNVWCV